MNRRNFLGLTGQVSLATLAATVSPFPLHAQDRVAPKKQNITTQGNVAKLFQEGMNNIFLEQFKDSQ